MKRLYFQIFALMFVSYLQGEEPLKDIRTISGFKAYFKQNKVKSISRNFVASDCFLQKIDSDCPVEIISDVIESEFKYTSVMLFRTPITLCLFDEDGVAMPVGFTVYPKAGNYVFFPQRIVTEGGRPKIILKVFDPFIAGSVPSKLYPDLLDCYED